MGLFERFQRAGVKVITSHVTRNAVLGEFVFDTSMLLDICLYVSC